MAEALPVQSSLLRGSTAEVYVFDIVYGTAQEERCHAAKFIDGICNKETEGRWLQGGNKRSCDFGCALLGASFAQDDTGRGK